MTLAEFHAQLGAHDWFFQYSDDGRVYREGRESAARLTEASKESPDHKRLYGAWCDAQLHQQPADLAAMRAEFNLP